MKRLDLSQFDGAPEGPFEAAKHGDYGDYDGNCIVILGDDCRECVVLGRKNRETKAKAKLFAAAPTLLAELRRMYAVEDGLREVLRKTKTCSLDSSVRELVNQALAERGS